MGDQYQLVQTIHDSCGVGPALPTVSQEEQGDGCQSKEQETSGQEKQETETGQEDLVPVRLLPLRLLPFCLLTAPKGRFAY